LAFGSSVSAGEAIGPHGPWHVDPSGAIAGQAARAFKRGRSELEKLWSQVRMLSRNDEPLLQKRSDTLARGSRGGSPFKTQAIVLFRFHEVVIRKSEISTCLVGQITGTGPSSPCLQEGTKRDRHGSLARVAMDACCVPCGRKRGSGRRNRVVLASRPWRLSTPPCGGVATVTKTAAHRGEHV
jgi:hypothetical protein